MRKESLKKDGTKNGVADDLDTDNLNDSGAAAMDSANGGDAVDPLDVVDQTSSIENPGTGSTSGRRNKTKAAKKVNHDDTTEKAVSNGGASKKAATNGDASDDQEEADYEVEDIVDHKIERKKVVFLVRWKNYGSSDDTWEPESSLSCPEIIAKYREAHPDAVAQLAASKRKSGSVGPASETSSVSGKGRKKRKVAAESGSTDAAAADEEYEVEDIVEHRIERKKNVFRIRWKGYEADTDTWEKEDTLSCPDIVAKYKKAHAGTLAEDQVSKPKKTPAEKKQAREERANKEFEVKRIVGTRVQKGTVMYQVRWKGYGIAADTWEKEDSLNCPELIAKFKEEQKLKRPAASKRQSTKKAMYGEVDSDVEDSEDEVIPTKKQRGGSSPVKKPAKEVEYEVERIIDDKTEKGSKMYLVKWKGWPSSSNTWQSRASLACPELLKKYEESRSTPKKKTKPVERTPKTITVTPKAGRGRPKASPIKTAVKTPKSTKKTPKSAKKTTTKSAKKVAKPAKKAKQTEEEDEPDWEVQEINDVKYNDDGSKDFLIRWKGCNSSQDTWEPEANLSCPALINKFMNKVDDSDAPAPKKKSRKA